MPTPRIAPIIVCELDDGRPKYQVPRFHSVAASSSDRIIARPRPTPLDTSSLDRQEVDDAQRDREPADEHPEEAGRSPIRMTAVHGRRERV